MHTEVNMTEMVPSSVVARTKMINDFARVDVALKMRVEDVETHGLRTWIRLYEREGKRYDLPVHHNLGEYLHAYIEGADLGHDKMGFLFRTARGNTGKLSGRPMSQVEAWRMLERRIDAASVRSKTDIPSEQPASRRS